jgi:MFS transporter, DHA2 family, multidrug resistance protein
LSIGISLVVTYLVRSTQHNRAELAKHASPFNEILSLHGFDLSSMGGLFAISREIDRQAAMIAYVNDFHIMTLLAFGALPLILLASRRRGLADHLACRRSLTYCQRSLHQTPVTTPD